MKQKIYEALKAKFAGGNAAVLNRIAERISRNVSDEAGIDAAVAGVTQDMLDIIESYGDSRANEAQQSAVSNYESKYNLKDGKPYNSGGETKTAAGVTNENNNSGGEGAIPEWAKALQDANKALQERLNMMDTARTTETRKGKLNEVIAKLPGNLRKPYERIQVDAMNDDDFTAMIKDVTEEVGGLVSALNTKGAVFGKPQTGTGGGDGDGLTKEQEAAIATRAAKPNAGGQAF